MPGLSWAPRATIHIHIHISGDASNPSAAPPQHVRASMLLTGERSATCPDSVSVRRDPCPAAFFYAGYGVRCRSTLTCAMMSCFLSPRCSRIITVPAERVDGIPDTTVSTWFSTEARTQRQVSRLNVFPFHMTSPGERFFCQSCRKFRCENVMRLEKRRYRAPEKVGANHKLREGVRPPRSDSLARPTCKWMGIRCPFPVVYQPGA